MKIIIYIVCLYVISSSCAREWSSKHGLPPIIGPKPKNDFIKSATIDIPLDHFHPNNKTWTMKYYLNDQFFKKNGPILLMLGGEWTITTDWVQYGQMFDIANQTGAFMFYTQHRFYGESLTSNNGINLSTDNLKYLSVDQVLADVAYFLGNLKNSPKFKDSKIIVFGGSYAGTLSISLRAKYPDLIHGAVASSAPIKGLIDFQDYGVQVNEILGKKCSTVINNAIKQIFMLMGTPKGVQKLQKDYNMCTTMDTSNILDNFYLFSHITTHFANVVQYASCGSVESTCEKLMEPKNMDDYTKLALYLNKTFSPDCLPNYQELKEHLTDLSSNGRNSRQWFYQQCSHLGYFQTYSTQPLEMYQSWCKEFFGSLLTPEITKLGVHRNNLIYGELLLSTTRVISVHGTADPWHLLGPTESKSKSFINIKVNGSSHCQDLYPISACDSLELVEAKLSVQKYVKQWLTEE